MTNFTPRKTFLRMPEFDYRGGYNYLVTVTTEGRARRFTDPRLVAGCLEALDDAARTHGFDIGAYCFMPDHVHILAQGRHEQSDLIAFVKRFKQLTGYRFKQATGAQLWQRSYHDRLLRRDESVDEVSSYIWMNPVRAGLAEFVYEYPYSGPRRFLDGPEGPSLQASGTSSEERRR